jgi:hypothetical protein
MKNTLKTNVLTGFVVRFHILPDGYMNLRKKKEKMKERIFIYNKGEKYGES